MSAILEQLELNNTFFIQIAIFAALFFILTRVYFRPFLKLFQTRHKRTVEDQEAADRLSAQAQAKLEEYKSKLQEARVEARRDLEAAIAEARVQESKLLLQARDDAKKITQEAVESINQQRMQIKKQLESDVEGLARSISESLLSRKV